jgi:NADH:ubiquinone oxidoreductase subunit E
MDRETILKKYKPTLDNILYILHDLQNNNPQNYLDKDDIAACSDYLKTPYSYTHSVASFTRCSAETERKEHYPSLRFTPVSLNGVSVSS